MQQWALSPGCWLYWSLIVSNWVDGSETGPVLRSTSVLEIRVRPETLRAPWRSRSPRWRGAAVTLEPSFRCVRLRLPSRQLLHPSPFAQGMVGGSLPWRQVARCDVWSAFESVRAAFGSSGQHPNPPAARAMWLRSGDLLWSATLLHLTQSNCPCWLSGGFFCPSLVSQSIPAHP